jgi:hypothetical protein
MFYLLWVLTSFMGIPMILERFEVTNGTKHTVYVTPYGQWEGSGDLGTLPIFAIPYPSVISPFVTDLKIKPRARKEIWFDGDDILLKGLLIRSSDRQDRMMSTNTGFPADHFTITDTTPLTTADYSMIHVLEDARYLHLTILYSVILLGLLNIPYYIWLLAKGRREKQLSIFPVDQ